MRFQHLHQARSSWILIIIKGARYRPNLSTTKSKPNIKPITKYQSRPAKFHPAKPLCSLSFPGEPWPVTPSAAIPTVTDAHPLSPNSLMSDALPCCHIGEVSRGSVVTGNASSSSIRCFHLPQLLQTLRAMCGQLPRRRESRLRSRAAPARGGVRESATQGEGGRVR